MFIRPRSLPFLRGRPLQPFEILAELDLHQKRAFDVLTEEIRALEREAAALAAHT